MPTEGVGHPRGRALGPGGHDRPAGPDLVAAPVAAALHGLTAFAAPIDPDLADTAAFCEAYGSPLDASANCVVVAGSRGGERRLAACVVLATTRGAVGLWDARFEADDVLLLGSEGRGAPDHVHAAAALRVAIPMRPGLRSLNVAVAGAMVLGEMVRQVRGLDDLSTSTASTPSD